MKKVLAHLIVVGYNLERYKNTFHTLIDIADVACEKRVSAIKEIKGGK